MTTICKYCNEEEDKQNRPGLICDNCMCFVHLTCLQRPGTPGDFVCDVFFDFVCEDCSIGKVEVFNRNKFPWVNVIYLTLSHLSSHSYGISNHGYFHYKTHICSFIDRYWQILFGPQSKQKKNWVGTIAGVLSVHNKLFFKSGSTVLSEAGWWKLLHNFSPAVAAHIIQELARDKPKVKPRNQLSLDKTLFLAKITEMGYKDLINNDEETECMMQPIPCKKRRVDSDDMSGVSSASTATVPSFEVLRHDLPDDVYDDSSNVITKDDIYSDMEFKEFDFTTTNSLLPVASDTSSMTSFRQSTLYCDSESHSSSEQEKRPAADTRPKRNEERPVRRESLFSAELNSVGAPWRGGADQPRAGGEVSPYEEIQLLKRIEGMIPKVMDSVKKGYLCRLRAKLALRRLKRHKQLPLFDLDKTVKLLGGYVNEDPKVGTNSERVLDRFQRSYLMENLCGTIASTNYGTLLLSHIEAVPFRSSYSGTTLKPYIRRDADSAPGWLALTDDLLRKTNKHIKGYEPPPRATIDYSYVRPQHIAAVNNMCAQIFWPGIDVTEALQYPEFSCVVTYKRLVVGCAFLVPDVDHNTAYISFILTRPGWRNAKIASFMLYHLLQTCTGQDVTLHCSPTNPAIFLYQKFGFKVEELIQDFYEKYYDIDYKGCRHALFLRLVR